MSNVAKEKFDFDEDAELSEEELKALESLEDDYDFDLDEDFEAGDNGLWDEGGDDNAVADDTDLDSLESEFTDTDVETDAGDVAEMPPVEEAEFEIPVEAAPEETSVEATDLVSVASVMEVAEADDDLEDMRMDTDHRPVPRINIDVFCESTEFSTLMESAAADRRLGKAHVTIMSGGIRKAVDYFRNQNTPNLIILETIKGGEELMQGLNGLAEVCDPSTRVIIVGHINDIALYRELISKGVSEYLISPRSPLTMIRSIASLYADPSAAAIGRNIAFVGARGGVGSSTLCHNVGWAVSEQFKSDTVIIDLDLPFGTASLDLEQDPSQGLAEALAAPERLDDVLLDRLLQKCTDRLSLFAAPNLLDREYSMPDDAYESVMDLVRTTAPNIMIDVPHVWTGWSRYLLQSADEIVITATPDLASFRNTKNIVEALKAHRSNDTEPTLILNQVNVPKRTEVPAEQFKEALGFGPSVIIEWDPQLFGNASANGQTLLEAGPKSKTAESVGTIAGAIMGQTPPKPKGGFSLSSLFSKR